MTKDEIANLRSECREKFYEMAHGADAQQDAQPVFVVSVDMAAKVYVRANSFGDENDPLKAARRVLAEAVAIIAKPEWLPSPEQAAAMRAALARLEAQRN